MVEYRDYQKKAIDKGVDFFNKNAPPSIIVAPTAAGKSWYIAGICDKLKDKTLILQPSKELLEQNYQKFSLINGNASIFSASFKKKEFGNITYATLGSIKNFGKQFKEEGYKNLIIDEVHLYPRNVDSMLGKFLKESEIKKILGLTATPFKLQTNSFNGVPYSKLQMLTSKSKKGKLFEDIIDITQISEIKNKYWSKLIYKIYEFNEIDLKYNSTRSDYTEESLKISFEKQGIKELINKELKENTDRKSVLVFCSSVSSAKELQKYTPNSGVLYSGMPDKDRNALIKAFKIGQIRTIFNVNILSTGFDYDAIDMIIVARPTMSLALWYQIIGRGTRINHNKKNCLIIDLSGNTKKFGRIEYLRYIKEKNTWKLYGENNKLLTGVPLDLDKKEINVPPKVKEKIKFSFGRFKGVEVKNAPIWYLKWVLNNIKDRSKITEEIKKILNG